jgi:hypothetical protein
MLLLLLCISVSSVYSQNHNNSQDDNFGVSKSLIAPVDFKKASGDKKVIETLTRSNFTNQQWNYYIRSFFSYDNLTNLSMEEDKKYSNDQWSDNLRTTFYYDESGNLILEIREAFITSWEPSSKYEYEYTNGKLSKITQYLHPESDWAYRRQQKDYVYDNNGRLASYSTYEWNNNQWELRYQNSYSYDNDGNVLRESVELWQSDTWLLDNEILYSYTDGKLVQSIMNQYNDTEISTSYKADYSYDINGNNTLIQRSFKNTGDWMNDTQTIQEFDEEGDVLLELTGVWNGAGYDDDYKLEYVYQTISDVQDEPKIVANLANINYNYLADNIEIQFLEPNFNNVTIRIYNLFGKLIVKAATSSPANSPMLIDASKLASGVYAYEIISNNKFGKGAFIIMK